ncbi:MULTISPECIES: phosphogluconate dehydrogenase C-terminal domain-containing protein [unclassified Rhizobium]|uniref:phosphogluconate dehydrogenase C-terminal domain-containing protein n=1 Tax=unclassified Rhizobium TaxID=2613769 RepID=UPI001ADB9490|nr:MULTISPECIES: phosphogluconate dehydrogenase C-terminal domain-containing protein [unclassified Rhizobium]MBO9096945.1 NAD(P)-binding domain-containing protein [Rhizobium sp. L58/93]MBO9134214.1 NAD(P)-binding domain-containing protein [Rhizobium sp. B209b/85]MBO9167184.1 NAD(P)-binding domain-containing protein [Rhizobium sp. L245/93]MBO9183142.1 NAD(P)-binding domain-containing protein [Rhizobium sp. E27B/91]QXZ83493.1 NAD(P)-binding domain-containing protein [Rhizobium sp. K1/93]
MTSIALFGAGGKMGYRLAKNLKGSRFDVRHVEISDAGKARLKDDLGLTCLDVDAALDGADVVILAVPDTHIGKVAAGIADKLKPGTMVVALDAAAPFAGHFPERPDLTYFVTHPCHPPIFNDETEMQAKKDHFGGLFAKQHIVSALMQGPDEAYGLGEEIAKTIWAPVMRSHRVTVDQMAMLEPGLSETVAASLLVVMKQAMDECVKRGVPEEAARDFLLGHLNVLGAVIFGEVQGVFSDACNKAIEFGIPALMRDDWKKVFEPKEIADSIQRIT